MMKSDFPNFIYVLSLSLQIASSLMLTLMYWVNMEKLVLRNIFKSSSGYHTNNNHTVTTSAKSLQKSASEIYRYRISFMYLLLGFILSIFGEKGNNICCIILLIIVITAILTVIGFMFGKCAAKTKYKEDKTVDSSEFKKLIGDDLDITTNISSNEISELF